LRENDVFIGFVGAERFLLPELGLDLAEAAKVSFGVDEGVDGHALFGGGGVEALVVVGRESFKVGGFFAADDLGFGVDAGSESVHGGSGLAAGSGGFACVEAIGLELFLRCHTKRRIAWGRLVAGECRM
jgi:hypothetical protein